MSDQPNPQNQGWNDPNAPSPGYGRPGQGQSPYGQSRAPYGPPDGGHQQGEHPYSEHPYNQNPYGQAPHPGPYGGYQGQGPTMVPQPRGTEDPEDTSLPLYGASFGTAIKRYYKQYADFTGRASRAEYWWVYLYQGLVGLVLGGLATGAAMYMALSGWKGREGSQIQYGPDDWRYQEWDFRPDTLAVTLTIIAAALSMLWGLAHIVPQLSLSWRRLHDADFAGPFYFLNLIPGAGAIIVLVLTLMPSKAEGQRFDDGAPQAYAPPGY